MAYTLGEELGIAVWTEDEAGPYQTVPYTGSSWEIVGEPVKQSAEYERNGTAKLLTLFHPSTGEVRVKGVTQSTNAVLHPWLKEQLTDILSTLPPANADLTQEQRDAIWNKWQEGITNFFTPLHQQQPLRLILIFDNLAGHQSMALTRWFSENGILPMFTPLGGSWLNMAESIQRILKRRALDGQHPSTPQQIIDWLEATARAWNRNPTPFIWGGKRAARRSAFRERRRHRLGGSGAFTRSPIPKKAVALKNGNYQIK
jgi:transposase